MEKDRIYLSPPYLNGAEIEYIQKALDTNWVAPLGDNIDQLEREVAEFLGGGYTVALNSGTAAIHLGLKALDVGPGDEVYCADVTFVGSCNPILYLGATPVFIDADPDNWGMSADSLAAALADGQRRGKLPKAVIIVDIYGLPADYERLLALCERYRVPVLEDAAEALGSSYRGQMCGTLGEIGTLSFNANKIITTSGGGMVVTKSLARRDQILFWATQSKEAAPYYEHREIGYNYRLSNVSAGIGCGQLKTLPATITARRQINEFYRRELAGLPLSFYAEPAAGQCNHWLSVILLDPAVGSPQQLIDALAAENIEARRFWKPMHAQPLFRRQRFYSIAKPGRSVGEQLFACGVCLPSGTGMSRADLQRVTAIVKGVCQ